ncbi:MAG: threonine/serine dehydratase [Gammaproteobacteria bacterium]|nr:threonine/serine dehydratase [Gammaproteobacteria bacterium]
MTYTSSDVVAQAMAANARIDALILRTPLIRAKQLSAETSANVYLKLENRQTTGSFKLRGASNRLLTLTREQRAAGCVAASSGNHGAAVACAMQKLATQGVIFVPQQTSQKKIAAIRSYGGDVRYFGTDGLDTEQHAREYATRNDMTYLSPYNDRDVIAGQGTCGVEIVQQLPGIDAVFIAVGGGGLISGVGSVLRAHNQEIRIYGCQPKASAVMAESVAAGRILDLPSAPTLSDGTAGGIETDAITFDLCKELIDEFVLVGEAEIAAAMRNHLASYDEPIEGAAGVALAALLARKSEIAAKNVVVVICGGNVSEQVMQQVQQ